MAIKISGTTVIDDSRNINSVGISTVGSGNSAVILNGITGIVSVGSGITMNGNTGDINISGILTVGQLSVPISIISFDPAIGSTSIGSTSISITFNQTVGVGTTGFIEVFVGTARSEFISVGSTRAFMTNGGTKLNIDPTNNFPGLSTVSIVMSSGFITANGSDFAGINTVGSGVSYSFTVSPALGESYEGGFLICQSGGTRWVVSPFSSQVSRTWHSRNDSNTTAQSVSGCTGWFVPTLGQLQNPGYICRNFWGPSPCFSSTLYWSDTEPNSPPPITFGCTVNFASGVAGATPKSCINFVRSFRCVTY